MAAGAEMGCGCTGAALISMQILIVKDSAKLKNCAINCEIQGNIISDIKYISDGYTLNLKI